MLVRVDCKFPETRRDTIKVAKYYNRGSAIGFINKADGKKYRLKTLALEEQFKQVDSLLKAGDKFKQDSKTQQAYKERQEDSRQPYESKNNHASNTETKKQNE